jgi:hypothetical protein
MVYAPTALNRTVYAAPPVGGLGYEKPQSALRAFVRFSLRHSLGRGRCYATPYYLPKPSYTAGTLYAIRPKLVDTKRINAIIYIWKKWLKYLILLLKMKLI